MGVPEATVARRERRAVVMDVRYMLVAEGKGRELSASGCLTRLAKLSGRR